MLSVSSLFDSSNGQNLKLVAEGQEKNLNYTLFTVSIEQSETN